MVDTCWRLLSFDMRLTKRSASTERRLCARISRCGVRRRLASSRNLKASTPDEKSALLDEASALVSSNLQLMVCRMDANMVLPGRGTAVELAFFKRYETTQHAVFDLPPLPARFLQLVGLSLGYATAVLAANLFLNLLSVRHDIEAAAFVLRVVDCMLPAARSLADIVLAEEENFVASVHTTLSGAVPSYDAAFVASLRTKWTAAAMVQMRRERGLLDAFERMEKWNEDGTTRRRADVAEHGLKHCALPSCDKREASVQQFKFCSACRSVWYCSEEHGALHWAEHKPVCPATTAAQQAADGVGAGAA